MFASVSFSYEIVASLCFGPSVLVWELWFVNCVCDAFVNKSGMDCEIYMCYPCIVVNFAVCYRFWLQKRGEALSKFSLKCSLSRETPESIFR